MPIAYGKFTDQSLGDQDTRQRAKLMLNYLHTEAPNWLPGLPYALRNPSDWMRQELGLGPYSDESSALYPVSSLAQVPTAEEAQAMWLSPGYHHKAWLPVNDAMVMGFNVRQGMFSNGMQFDVHPFYGQNWHNSDSYWGTEIALSLRSDSPAAKPWGKIALRYDNGDSDLMERGRGYDLHGELGLADHLSLNTGVTQNEQTQLGNYVMLRWKLTGE